MCAEGQACPGGRVEPSPQGAPRSGEAEPALPGRPFQRAMRRQAAARRWRCRSAVNASRGVRQSRHLSGRSLSMRSIRLISPSRMASNGLPLGRILRTTPLRYFFASLLRVLRLFWHLGSGGRTSFDSPLRRYTDGGSTPGRAFPRTPSGCRRACSARRPSGASSPPVASP